MSQLKTILIDDEPQAISLLTQLARGCPEISIIASYSDPVKALVDMKSHHPDLLLLDVQMPRMNGFELLRGIRNTGLDPAVIFVTAFDQFVLDAIHHEAFDYLMKPVSPQELKDSVSRLMKRLSNREEMPSIDGLLKGIKTAKLQFSDRQGVWFIAPEEIICVEAEGNYSKFLCKTREHVITRQLGDIEEILAPHGFIRISRSAIINPVFLTRIDRKQRICVLENGQTALELIVSEEKMRGF